MSLIPFILELADELHEFNRCLATGGMDVDDFGFGIYPHELQPQQQQTQTQHPLQQQPPQQQHLSQQRRPRPLSQFYWMPNISKSRHHPYYRGKPCCNKTPIQLVYEHHLEKESSSTAGGGGGVAGTNTTGGTTAGDKESAANTHSPNPGTHNVSSTTAAGKSAYSVVNKNGFQVSMNVKQFAPNELTVKTIDNCIVVEGQHEDKEDGHGVISRHFIRKYMLPKGYDPNEVLSTLSSDGILTVKAPPPAMKTDETLERIVDIQHTGGPVQIQSTAKEPNTISSGKEDQANAAASGVEQAATSVTVVAGTLPTSATITLQQKQQQPQQPQQMAATVESVQQKPTKVAQPAIKDLQLTRERNGNLEPNELLAEQESEARTAEPTATSSNGDNISNNNNINDNSEVSNINRSGVKSSVAASKPNLKTDIKEKDSLAEDDAKTVGSDNFNTNEKALTSSVAITPAIDAIMTAVTADEPMETEETEEEIVKDVGKKTAEDSLLTSDIEDALPLVSDMNSVANSSSSSNNNSNSNNFATNNHSLNIVETNGIEITSANNVDIELASSAIVEASDIIVVTNNGVPEIKTAEGLTISLETAASEIDETTELEAEVSEAADAVDADMDADDLDGAADIGVGVDVNIIGDGGSRASVEDGNDESSSVGNLVVVAQSPSAGDLVAAADAAILLSKTQCDVNSGAGDVAAGKLAITTEEITN
ncbi:heat shock protein 67B1 [Rhagoletis pomonella]|uniref:heat shock protein 67B1 n=1 Tax=Rhagoletis pomonella TaxID=28610 RepID=UPI0017816DDE|nr:heat shock protein 67B1 [Rhagoletis pomonella]